MKHEDDLIGAAVLVIFEFAVSLFRARAVSGHVRVEEHGDAACVEITPPRNLGGLDVVMAQRTLRDFFRRPILYQLDVPHACRRPEMIDNGVRFIEAFRRDDVLVSDPLILVGGPASIAMKPDMMLFRNLAELLIIRHVYSPLQIASCVLLLLQSLEQGFKVTFAKTLRAFALNNLKKEGRPVFHWLGEDLKQITFVIAIDENS